MKLQQLKCPSCGAGMDIDVKGRDTVFCPYCGSQFAVDDGETKATYTYNVNYHERYTDDAAVEKERRKDRENEREHKELKWFFIGFGILMLLLVGIGIIEDISDRVKRASGMVQVGQSYEDMEGQNYRAVVSQLESAGFKNITTIDLEDAILIIRPADTVESVSIGGETTFYAHDYYDPDIPIVIAYH